MAADGPRPGHWEEYRIGGLFLHAWNAFDLPGDSSTFNFMRTAWRSLVHVAYDPNVGTFDGQFCSEVVFCLRFSLCDALF